MLCPSLETFTWTTIRAAPKVSRRAAENRVSPSNCEVNAIINSRQVINNSQLGSHANRGAIFDAYACYANCFEGLVNDLAANEGAVVEGRTARGLRQTETRKRRLT